MIRGEGPSNARLFICGEGPGYWEQQIQRVFVGKTGEELERYLDGIQLPLRSECFLTNLYREYRGKDYEYTSEDFAQCEPMLLQELQRVKPSLIVPLGRHAARYFLGDVDIGEVQGLAWQLPPVDKLSFLGNTTVVFPITHPAAAMYNSEMSPYVVAGFHELGRYLRGEIEPRTLFDDSHPETHYEEITEQSQLAARLTSITKDSIVATDTEGFPAHPWSLQWSTHAGSGYLIRHSHPELLRRFAEHLSRVRPRLVFHSALHDLGMFRALGLDIDDLAFDDTMVMAYLLQIEEQGLKALCVRHCGMKMQSYEEVVGDVGQRLALDYLTWLWEAEEAEYEEACQAEFQFQRSWGRKIKKAPKLPKSGLHKAVQRCLQSKDARALWERQNEDIQVAGYRRLGSFPTATLDYVPAATAIHYGCRDADGTTRIASELGKRIDSMGLREVYELELRTYPLIERMSYIGLKPDLGHFAQLSRQLDGELVVLQTEIERATGQAGFNGNSGDQVAAYLFDSLGLESMKRTSTGRGSTNDKILEALEREHPEYPVIAVIRSYRELYKLKNTFVDRLPDFVDRWPHDGRIHATFRTTRVVTGRLAASDPNVLAQPEHGKFAGDFKRGWVCDDGHVLCQWDESQLEMRTLAHLSQDPTLLSVYRGELRNPDGSIVDLHARLAQRIFGVEPKNQDKHKHRYPAKTINFLIPMGGTAHGLSIQLRANGLDVDEDDAQRWLDETMAFYSEVPKFMDACIEEAERNGFIRWHPGRIRYIGGIWSFDDRVRAEAERFSFSTKIQGLAQTVMKEAEAVVWRKVLPYFWKRRQWVEPILQVHDCLKVECANGIKDAVNTHMIDAMTQSSPWMSVPLVVEGEHGLNMADMEAF